MLGKLNLILHIIFICPPFCRVTCRKDSLENPITERKSFEGFPLADLFKPKWINRAETNSLGLKEIYLVLKKLYISVCVEKFF